MRPLSHLKRWADSDDVRLTARCLDFRYRLRRECLCRDPEDPGHAAAAEDLLDPEGGRVDRDGALILGDEGPGEQPCDHLVQGPDIDRRHPGGVHRVEAVLAVDRPLLEVVLREPVGVDPGPAASAAVSGATAVLVGTTAAGPGAAVLRSFVDRHWLT